MRGGLSEREGDGDLLERHGGGEERAVCCVDTKIGIKHSRRIGKDRKLPGGPARGGPAIFFDTGSKLDLDLISRRESFRTPTLPRFHKGNSGGELAVAAWQLTEADSGGPPQLFRGGSTGEGTFSRSLQEQLRGSFYMSN